MERLGKPRHRREDRRLSERGSERIKSLECLKRFVGAIVLAFFYHWWAAIIMFFAATILGGLTKLIWGRSVSYYLSFIHHKMLNRATDYKRDNDAVRFEAADSYCKDLMRVMLLYDDSGLKPPTPKQLKEVPNGDLLYWLEAHEHKGDLTPP